MTTNECMHSVQNFQLCAVKHTFSLVLAHKLMRFMWKCDLLSLTSLFPQGPWCTHWAKTGNIGTMGRQHAAQYEHLRNGLPALSSAPVEMLMALGWTSSPLSV